MIRLVQLIHPQAGRRLALVDEPVLMLIQNYRSVYALARAALEAGQTLATLLNTHRSEERLDYDEIYAGTSDWQLLPAFDHPDDPYHCLVSGTGLTHRASADNRQNMHQDVQPNELTDSMRMYQWGAEGGRPDSGHVGVQPEWFYKGNGTILRAANHPLDVPPYALDGGEEPEVAGAYLIDRQGQPWRVGFCPANEFSDHVMEKQNYLYLAPSKLRNCSLGPELLIDADFQQVTGSVRIRRDGQDVWSATVRTGEQHMVHSLANLEHHHFKYAEHRLSGQAHVHFFGTADFSFGHQVALQDGDVMEVAWEGWGRPLRNPLRIQPKSEEIISARIL